MGGKNIIKMDQTIEGERSQGGEEMCRKSLPSASGEEVGGIFLLNENSSALIYYENRPVPA